MEVIKKILGYVSKGITVTIDTLFNLIDNIMIIFTYMSVVVITIIAVKYFFMGYTFNSLIACGVAIGLSYLNKLIRGGK